MSILPFFLVGFLPFKTKIDLDLDLLPVLSEINPVLLVLSGVMLTSDAVSALGCLTHLGLPGTFLILSMKVSTY